MRVPHRLFATLQSIARALNRRNETGWSFALPVLVVFVVVQILLQVRHEPWRDELTCWATSRTASGLWDLLTGDRRYDGHPFLWYYLLHLVSRLTPSYHALHFVAVGLAASAAAIWLRWAPVPRILRVMLLASYYFLYEYAVISRSYGLGWVLICAVCALYHPLRIRYVWSGVLLGLLCATSLYGMEVSIALAWFVFSHGLAFERTMEGERRLKVGVTSRWLIGVSVFMAGLIITVVTTLPPSDAVYAPHHLPDVTMTLVRDAAGWYWKALFPFNGFERWDWTAFNYLGSKWRHGEQAAPWLGAGWLLAWMIALRRRPRLALTYLGGALLIAAAQSAIYIGGWRHIGHYVVLQTACVWLYARDTRGRAPARLLYTLFALNLLVQIPSGFTAARTDWKETFSGAQEAARYIRDHRLEDLPVVGHTDAASAAVAAMLRKPFYYPATGETSDVVLFHNRRGGPTEGEVVQHAVRLAREGKGKALLVLSYDTPTTIPGAKVHLLHRGKPALVGDESFRIYSVEIQR